MTAFNPIRIGIAGYGVVGKRRSECIDRNSSLKLVAVCDQNFQGEGQLKDDVRFFQDFETLLEQDIDAIFVCMPNDVAPVVTNKALEMGRHVFCEKPPGRNLSDIQQTQEIELANPNLRLMYGFNHRYHDSVQDALKIVQSGELGKVIHLNGIYGKSQLITFNQSSWRTQRAIAGGGVLLDQGIHMVDLMRLFAGEFDQVHSFVSNNYWGFDVEDNAYALMRTKEGVVAMLNSSATQWRHRFHLDINLEKGSLTLGGILSGSKSYGAETLRVTYADPKRDNGDPKEVVTRYNHDPSWDIEVERFANYIAENRIIDSCSSTDALKTMQLIERIYTADPSWREKYFPRTR